LKRPYSKAAETASAPRVAQPKSPALHRDARIMQQSGDPPPEPPPGAAHA
jgi:hypothetical protein